MTTEEARAFVKTLTLYETKLKIEHGDSYLCGVVGEMGDRGGRCGVGLIIMGGIVWCPLEGPKAYRVVERK